jgi:hypothetical protein
MDGKRIADIQDDEFLLQTRISFGTWKAKAEFRNIQIVRQ